MPDRDLLKPFIKYDILFLFIFLIEVLIAFFVNDHFIRPFVGDALVVILIYCFVMFLFTAMGVTVSKVWVSLGVLVFAFCVEFAQLANVLDLLNLRSYKIARVVLGTSYDWKDLLAYSCGYFIIRITDR